MFPKFDELRNIPKLSNAAVIGISKSKLDDSVLSSEMQTGNDKTLCCDRNRHGGGVVCYIRKNLHMTSNLFFRLKLKTFSSNYYYQIRNQ